MKKTPGIVAAAALLAVTTIGLLWSDSAPVPAVQAAEPAAEPADRAADAGVPVEPDMHEFMEYVFQPTYKRLKAQMAAEPADNQGWKAIKADALTLAEGGNLLLIRQPEDDRKDWTRHSIQVRDLGGQLYRAAGAKDFKTARQRYEAMLTNCNACHQQFAGGEHQLKP